MKYQQGKPGVDCLQNHSITGAAGRSDPRRLITSTAVWGKSIRQILFVRGHYLFREANSFCTVKLCKIKTVS